MWAIAILAIANIIRIFIVGSKKLNCEQVFHGIFWIVVLLLIIIFKLSRKNKKSNYNNESSNKEEKHKTENDKLISLNNKFQVAASRPFPSRYMFPCNSVVKDLLRIINEINVYDQKLASINRSQLFNKINSIAPRYWDRYGIIINF